MKIKGNGHPNACYFVTHNHKELRFTKIKKLKGRFYFIQILPRVILNFLNFISLSEWKRMLKSIKSHTYNNHILSAMLALIPDH